MSGWLMSPPPNRTPAPVSAPLPVVETFHSLQGEGQHAGRSAFFLRLAGCRVGCPWCDTKHSWPAGAHPLRPLAALAEEAQRAAEAGAAFAVITGGEPLHHDLGPLCAQLQAATTSPERPAGLPLHLETSGVDPLSGAFAWITLSPKRHRPPCDALLRACDELKVVVQQPADLAFAEAMAARARDPVLLLQPAWDEPEGQRLAMAHVLAHPAWRLSLQTHKFLGVR